MSRYDPFISGCLLCTDGRPAGHLHIIGNLGLRYAAQLASQSFHSI